MTCILATAVVMYLGNGSIDYFTVVSWIYAAVILLTCRISEWNNDESRRSERHVQDKDRTEKMWGAVDTIDHYSYDIYLAHGVVFEALTLIKPRLPFSPLTTGIFMFAAMTALTAFGAVIMHRICERISRRR